MARDIVLICLDSVRLDYFNEYAPRLRDLADIEFSECRAASSWSVPSHGSMMTGSLPTEHGAHAFNQSFHHLEQADTWLGECADHTSVGMSANPYASPDFGFDGLFDKFIATRSGRHFPSGMSVDSFGWDRDQSGMALYWTFIREALRHEHPGASVTNAIIQKSRNVLKDSSVPQLFDDGAKLITRQMRKEVNQSEKPIIAFANLMEAHEPMVDRFGYSRELYDVPLGWASSTVSELNIGELDREFVDRYRGVYCAAIDYLDRIVSELVESLLANRDVTVVVTADHGENLGYEADDGLFGHVGSLSEALLHVPLLVINPPESATNGVVDQYVSHLGLPELLVSIANEGWKDITRDVVVAERIGGTQWADETAERSEDYWDRMIRVAYRGNTKIEWDSLGDAYETTLGKAPDIWNLKEKIELPPDWATRQFKDIIEDARKVAETGGGQYDVSSDVQNRLKELGYL